MPATELPSLPDIEQLSDRVWRVMGLNPSKFCLQGTNTYLIGLGDRKILVDMSDEGSYLSHLQHSLKSISSSAYISDILITHCHDDHWRSLESIMQSDLNSPLRPIRVHKYPLEPSGADMAIHMEDFPSDIFLEDLYDQQVFTIDDEKRKTTLQVIYTPGHSEDHCCFWLKEENTLLSGDCLVGHGISLVRDMSTYMASLETLVNVAPDRLYPGHGAVVDDGLDFIQANLDYRRKREALVIETLQSPCPDANAWSSLAIARKLHGENAHPNTIHIVAGTILFHLLKLRKEGRARIFDESEYDRDRLYDMLGLEWYYIQKHRL